MPQKLNERDIFTNTHVQIDRLIFASCGTHAMNYFGAFGDFYPSGTQDAEVTKSLNLVTVIVICLPTKHFAFPSNPLKRDREFLIELDFGSTMPVII